MKYLQGFIIFFFVGLFLAVMVGPGDNYYRKKSEKVSFPIEVYLIFGLVGGIVGIGIGSSWEEQEKKKPTPNTTFWGNNIHKRSSTLDKFIVKK